MLSDLNNALPRRDFLKTLVVGRTQVVKLSILGGVTSPAAAKALWKEMSEGRSSPANNPIFVVPDTLCAAAGDWFGLDAGQSTWQSGHHLRMLGGRSPGLWSSRGGALAEGGHRQDGACAG